MMRGRPAWMRGLAFMLLLLMNATSCTHTLPWDPNLAPAKTIPLQHRLWDRDSEIPRIRGDRKGIIDAGEARRVVGLRGGCEDAGGVDEADRCMASASGGQVHDFDRKELDRALGCSMCMSFLVAPKALLCGHSFCSHCIDSWFRTGSRICPLCRSSSGADKMRPNLALDTVSKIVYGEEYERRVGEIRDMTMIPPKGMDALGVIQRSELLSPSCSMSGSGIAFLVPSNHPSHGQLLNASQEDKSLLYVSGNRDNPGEDLRSLGQIGVEVTVDSLDTVNATILSAIANAPSGSHIMVVLVPHDRVRITELTRDAEGGVWGRGTRVEDQVGFGTPEEMEEVCEELRCVLPLLQANIYTDRSNSIPSDPMGLSFYASFWLQKLLALDHQVWARSLELTSTRRRLVEASELLSRAAVSEIKKGTLLVSSRDEDDDMFGRSVVLIYRHDSQSTEGVIINKKLAPDYLAHLYPNGTGPTALPRGKSEEAPSLMLGGPVALRSGRRGTQLLTRGACAEHDPGAMQICDGIYLNAPRFLQDNEGPNGTVRTLPDSIEMEQTDEYESGSGGSGGSSGGSGGSMSARDGEADSSRPVSMEVTGDGTLERGSGRGDDDGEEGGSEGGLGRMGQRGGADGEAEGGGHGSSSSSSSGTIYQFVTDDMEGMGAKRGAGAEQRERQGGGERLEEQGGKVSDELLMHGVAVWVPYQLDREVRMGGWKIIPEANASVVFDMDRNDMFSALEAEGSPKPFDSKSFLEWAKALEGRSEA